MLASEIREVLDNAPDDAEFGFNVVWKDDPDGPGMLQADMIDNVMLCLWRLDEEDE